jgi:hypothetical protein
MNGRELWTIFHGLVLGGLFLLAYVVVLVELSSLRQRWVTIEGARERISRLRIGSWMMACIAWVTVISGTYVALPWFRAAPSPGADLRTSPKFFLLSTPETQFWSMLAEWKEHVGWFAPILATALAYTISYYGPQLAQERPLRRALIWTGLVAFSAAGVAGFIGAMLNKVAPIR